MRREVVARRQGISIWYELITADVEAAQRFYGTVLGWRFERMPGGPEMDYRVDTNLNRCAQRRAR